jgi:undecaprenyl-diphosphatase
MSIWQTILLALIQGITEFLPISSSAHLILPSQVLGWQDQGLAFDVAVHLGSLAAVMMYFRDDILSLSQGWIKGIVLRQQSPESQLAWLIILATLPAVVMGYLVKDWVEVYARSAAIIGTTTIVFGLFLWIADAKFKHVRELDSLTWKKALLIGVSQVFALIPGTSRSGVTITAALMLGFSRQSAARFSFLMSIPVILGSGVLKGKDLLQQEALIDWFSLFVGVSVSFISAYICISMFIMWINRLGMLPFVIYRLLLGVILFVFVFL